MRYYDPIHKRLIYLSQRATADYWDEHWDSGTPDASLQRLLQGSRSTYVSRITRRYLRPEEGPILEGGCGTGQHVAALSHAGYNCTGVDYAEKTVDAIRAVAPELDVRLGDITALEFDDATFAGYWSVGVIEHFWDGYEACVAEMARVLRPGGYLFVTFPHLSPLRQWKVAFNAYPHWRDGQSNEAFYQFALDHQRVLETFTARWFEPVNTISLDGLKGFKDEMVWIKRPLQQLYNYRGKSVPIRGMRLVLTRALAPLAGHSMLLVLRRNTSGIKGTGTTR